VGMQLRRGSRPSSERCYRSQDHFCVRTNLDTSVLRHANRSVRIN
jgi:hypothetical protein